MDRGVCLAFTPGVQRAPYQCVVRVSSMLTCPLVWTLVLRSRCVARVVNGQSVVRVSGVWFSSKKSLL